MSYWYGEIISGAREKKSQLLYGFPKARGKYYFGIAEKRVSFLKLTVFTKLKASSSEEAEEGACVRSS
ncbi:hypothetical protein, partial [Klebsiella pneumoniae]|uniref:hypothetical protein n=1 Tax=Klebsiella pneumoniae TaxID=573 RepID=UPI001C6F5E23